LNGWPAGCLVTSTLSVSNTTALCQGAYMTEQFGVETKGLGHTLQKLQYSVVQMPEGITKQ
jgi:hypothetical protein